MSTPRRRIVRPAPARRPERRRQLQKAQAGLERERAALACWMARLKRAFHAVEKSQARASRLERRVAQLEADHATNCPPP